MQISDQTNIFEFCFYSCHNQGNTFQSVASISLVDPTTLFWRGKISIQNWKKGRCVGCPVFHVVSHNINTNLVNFGFIWRCPYPRIRWWRFEDNFWSFLFHFSNSLFQSDKIDTWSFYEHILCPNWAYLGRPRYKVPIN